MPSSQNLGPFLRLAPYAAGRAVVVVGRHGRAVAAGVAVKVLDLLLGAPVLSFAAAGAAADVDVVAAVAGSGRRGGLGLGRAAGSGGRRVVVLRGRRHGGVLCDCV